MDLNPQLLVNAQAKFQEIIEREECEESLYAFLKKGWKYIDPAPFVGGWHLEAIAEHLQAVTDGQIRRLLINVPPRSSKSSVASVCWPAWTWAQSRIGPCSGPHVQFLSTSYAQTLSLRDSVKNRRLIESPFYKKYWGNRFTMTGDVNTKGRFENDKGGYRIATAVGAALTGEGGQVIIVDDAHNASEVESDLVRTSTLSWWAESLSTRLNDPQTGAYVVIMQRLHQEDLTGYILSREREDWVHLCYDQETEILSRNGWVRFADLQPGIEVLGVDPSSLVAKWESPTNYVCEKYTGEIIHYKSLTADLMVTPDHRMIFANQHDITNGEVEKWRVRPAEELPGVFYLPQVVKWDGSRDAVLLGDRMWGPLSYAEFMGWYLSEGYANAKGRTTTIFQKQDGSRVEELCQAMAHIPYNVTRCKHRGDMDQWQIKNRHLANDLAKLGGSTVRRVPEAIKNLAPEFLRAFLIAYAMGDGHFAVRNPKKITIGTSSKLMADDLQECAIKAGWSASLSVGKNGAGYFPNGYERKESTIYKVYIRASKAVGRERKNSSKIRKVNTKKIPYNSNVYCVSVPSGGLVVRRAGRVAISGNCLPMEHEKSRHCITMVNGAKFWEDPRTEEGELLCDRRFSLESVRNLSKRLGDFAAAGQLQQSPIPRGGGIIKQEWWGQWTDPTYPQFSYVVASLDTAYTEKEENDASALTIWGVYQEETTEINKFGATIIHKAHPKIMLIYGWQARLALPDLVEKVKATCGVGQLAANHPYADERRFRIDKLLIESKASGISVYQELQRVVGHNSQFSIELFNPTKLGDKWARVYSVQHLFSEGLVYVPWPKERDGPNKGQPGPKPHKWAEEIIDQFTIFPRGAHDDLVDSGSQALRWLRDSGLLLRNEEHAHDEREEMVYRGRTVPLYGV